jgi:hypothetical protein
MNRFTWQIVLGISLFAASIALYIAQIAIFHDQRNTFFYLIQDLAFIPIQVLLVTLILNQLLNVREKLSMLNKLNMVIGTFFSEAGTPLLRSFSEFDAGRDRLRDELLVSGAWSDRDFAAAAARARSYNYQIRYTQGDFAELRTLLLGKRAFLLGLLENPNLLEHETFTEMLWAVFHLTEELSVREDVRRLSPTDGEHLAADIRRAYAILIVEWLAYMKHLKHDYPYLFSFALRTNPFDPNAQVVVK